MTMANEFDNGKITVREALAGFAAFALLALFVYGMVLIAGADYAAKI